MTRRDFLGKVGWGAIVVAVGALAGALARFFEPNVTTPAPGPVEIGAPGDYPVGSLTFVERARAYLGRDERGLYALTAICTHLGCTPRLESDTLVCPCHGSRFTRQGQVVSGRAPRALERAFVGRGANGRLFIDRGRPVDASYRLPVPVDS
ncbi:MAG: Rieske 2Fe-2S domain-containing protein [Chloroflexi bacterium]|nr:Rieske 2Fe-2S domain-containing protein [Chloroflexota bacterium]